MVHSLCYFAVKLFSLNLPNTIVAGAKLRLDPNPQTILYVTYMT